MFACLLSHVHMLGRHVELRALMLGFAFIGRVQFAYYSRNSFYYK